jgi:phage tail-like protein
MPPSRPFAAGRPILELDGVVCGALQSAAGGAIAADVVTVRGQGFFDEKHLGQVMFEDLELQLGLSLDRSVYDWISASWLGKASRRDGTILATDFAGKAVSEREFFRGLLTAVTLPALDAASKDAAYLSLKISPEYTRFRRASGGAVKLPGGKQKEWLASRFRLDIDGLDTGRVSKVDALSVTQAVVRDQPGETRGSEKLAGRLEFPNLRVTVAASDADTWTAWFDDFVVRGNDDASRERNGKLTFLAADGKTPLAEVSLFSLGIFRLEPEAQEAGADTIARIVADLYCERMELAVP